MKIIYFGNNIRGVQCLKALAEAGYVIASVVVHPDAADKSRSESVSFLAKQLGIRVLAPKNVNSSAFLADLQMLRPDLMILSGYNQILKKEVLSLPVKGTINPHGGRLPHYRGGSPINWQIINGESEGACSILYVDEGIDTGDLLAQEPYAIGPDETAAEVTKKTLEIFPALLIDVVRKIQSGTLKPIKQDVSAGNYYCKRYPKDGKIQWDQMNAQEVHNLVRALNGPNLPGAFTFLDGKKIIVWKTKLTEQSIKGVPCRIAVKSEEGLMVICRDKAILVSEIKENENPEILPAKNHFKICGMNFC